MITTKRQVKYLYHGKFLIFPLEVVKCWFKVNHEELNMYTVKTREITKAKQKQNKKSKTIQRDMVKHPIIN